MFCGPHAMLVTRLAFVRLQIEPPERYSSHHRAHGPPPAVCREPGLPARDRPYAETAPRGYGRPLAPSGARLEAPGPGEGDWLSLPGWPGRLWVYFLSEGLVEGFLPNRFSN